MSIYGVDSFRNPSKRYRPLQIVHGFDRSLDDPKQLTGLAGIDRFLDKLVAMGTGGIVASVGFADYLVSPRQWEIYRYGLEQAAKRDLVLWWYDEKGYPSGTAGGMVTRAHPELVALGLACYTLEVDGPGEISFGLPPSCRRLVWAGAVADSIQGAPDNALDLSDHIDKWSTLWWAAPAGRWKVVYLAERVMYEGTHSVYNVCEEKHYINLLKVGAAKAFLRLTHERYHRETPAALWDKTVAVFTDEPSLMTPYTPANHPERYQGKIPVVDAPIFSDRPPAVPWSDDVLRKFEDMKGYDLRPHLFQLFLSEAEEAWYVRQDYYDVITQMNTGAFYGQVRRWCAQHKIAFSGHVLAEEDLLRHVGFHGSLFSVVRQMDLPGIDMLNADPQDMLAGNAFMTAKQVSSVGHLTGAHQIHSETSDWEQVNAGRPASWAERIGQANLLYVLGINLITSYYQWQDIGEEGWRQYNDYVGRLGLLLTGGRHICDVAVLYPVRTAWAHVVPASEPPASWYGPLPSLSPWARRVSEGYNDLVRFLLRQQIDVDIIDEEAIIGGESRDGALHIADEAYRVILLPPLHALALGTAQALTAFCQVGGTLISVGPVPEIAESSARTTALCREMASLFGQGGPGKVVPTEQLVAHLRGAIGADLSLEDANEAILYTHRNLEGGDVYFIINNAPAVAEIRPKLRAPGPCRVYRPLDGAIHSVAERLQLTLAGYEGLFIVCGPTSQRSR